MSAIEIKLKCTACRAYRDFERAGENVVRCSDCGKRHATASLFAVGEGDDPDFGDAGP